MSDTPPDSREERMAARARAQREETERAHREAGDRVLAEVRRRIAALEGDGWSWLNGWPRAAEVAVLMGTGVRCIGCGQLRGTTTVALEDDWTDPGPEPSWPHPVSDCPIHSLLDDL